MLTVIVPPEIMVRPAAVADAKSVAAIWFSGWNDGHLGNVPNELTSARTEASFYTRAADRVQDTTVAVVDGSVAGFIMVVGAEVEQVYVADAHRGAGVATRLLKDAERQVCENGHDTAWLAVVGGNERARRFYAKHGWVDCGPFDHEASGPNGPIIVPSHRYEKAVAA